MSVVERLPRAISGERQRNQGDGTEGNDQQADRDRAGVHRNERGRDQRKRTTEECRAHLIAGRDPGVTHCRREAPRHPSEGWHRRSRAGCWGNTRRLLGEYSTASSRPPPHSPPSASSWMTRRTVSRKASANEVNARIWLTTGSSEGKNNGPKTIAAHIVRFPNPGPERPARVGRRVAESVLFPFPRSRR